MSYDRYNVKEDRIFSSYLNGKIGGRLDYLFLYSGSYGLDLFQGIPGGRCFEDGDGVGPTVVEYEKQTFTESYCISKIPIF